MSDLKALELALTAIEHSDFCSFRGRDKKKCDCGAWIRRDRIRYLFKQQQSIFVAKAGEMLLEMGSKTLQLNREKGYAMSSRRSELADAILKEHGWEVEDG